MPDMSLITQLLRGCNLSVRLCELLHPSGVWCFITHQPIWWVELPASARYMCTGHETGELAGPRAPVFPRSAGVVSGGPGNGRWDPASSSARSRPKYLWDSQVYGRLDWHLGPLGSHIWRSRWGYMKGLGLRWPRDSSLVVPAPGGLRWDPFNLKELRAPDQTINKINGRARIRSDLGNPGNGGSWRHRPAIEPSFCLPFCCKLLKTNDAVISNQLNSRSGARAYG